MSSTNAQIYQSFPGIFSKRNKKTSPFFGEVFYRLVLRFCSHMKPAIPRAASSNPTAVFVQSGEVTKIAVGPSAPPITPILSAFANISFACLSYI